MKALSVRQPWAWLIVNGYKDVENRTWKTKFRGRFLVHASTTIDRDAWVEMATRMDLPRSIVDEIGGIVGSVNLVDCVQKSDSQWFQGPNGFLLMDAKTLPFHPCKGQLNFFNADLTHSTSGSGE